MFQDRLFKKPSLAHHRWLRRRPRKALSLECRLVQQTPMTAAIFPPASRETALPVEFKGLLVSSPSPHMTSLPVGSEITLNPIEIKWTKKKASPDSSRATTMPSSRERMRENIKSMMENKNLRTYWRANQSTLWCHEFIFIF